MVEESSDGGGAGKPGGGGGGDPLQSTKKVPTHEWKLCKGCLYYSSRLRSKGRSPPCIGTDKTLPRVPVSMAEKYEIIARKEGSLSYFRYGCIGYSMFWHDKDSPTKKQEKQTQLPVCAGYELLVGRRTPTASQFPAHVYKEEELFVRYQTRTHKLARKGFFSKFTRNAGVVGSGVARNLLIVGSYIKDNLEDILYPDRRRPK